MKCRAHEADLSALLDGELPATEERVLRDHLAGCPACRARLDLLTSLGRKLSAYREVTEVLPSSRFVDRVVATVSQRRFPQL